MRHWGRFSGCGCNGLWLPLTGVGSVGFGFGSRGPLSVGFACVVRHIKAELLADFQRDVIVNRAGVRLLFVNAQIREQLQNFVRLYFELPCQLVDSNFTHI